MEYNWNCRSIIYPRDRELLQVELSKYRSFSEAETTKKDLTKEEERYRLEAEYLLAEQPDRLQSIVLSHPNWNSELLEKVADQLVESYDLPVILIGHSGAGVARSGDKKFNLEGIIQSVSTLLVNWQGDSQKIEFLVEKDQIERISDRLQRLIKIQMSNYSRQKELTIEAMISSRNLSVKELGDLFTLVSQLKPSPSDSPTFALIKYELGETQIDTRDTHLSFNIKGNKFLWENQANKAKQIKNWQIIDLAFQVQTDSRKKERFTIVDVRPYLKMTIFSAISDIEVIDYRGVIPSSIDRSNLTDDCLFLPEIPYNQIHLQSLLQKHQPQILYIGSQILDQNSNIPTFLQQQWQNHYLFNTDRDRAIAEILTETRSFQSWWLSSPIGEITKICQRALR